MALHLKNLWTGPCTVSGYRQIDKIAEVNRPPDKNKLVLLMNIRYCYARGVFIM